MRAALVESMLIHTRELIALPLCAALAKYIRAFDYLPDPTVIPPKWPEYNRDLAQIDKDTTHLTYEDLPDPSRSPPRVTSPPPCWHSCAPYLGIECGPTSRPSPGVCSSIASQARD